MFGPEGQITCLKYARWVVDLFECSDMSYVQDTSYVQETYAHSNADALRVLRNPRLRACDPRLRPCDPRLFPVKWCQSVIRCVMILRLVLKCFNTWTSSLDILHAL